MSAEKSGDATEQTGEYVSNGEELELPSAIRVTEDDGVQTYRSLRWAQFVTSAGNTAIHEELASELGVENDDDSFKAELEENHGGSVPFNIVVSPDSVEIELGGNNEVEV